MSLIEGVDFVTELFLVRSNGSPKKRSLVISIFSILLFLSSFCFVFSLSQIMDLFHPVLFLLLFVLVGFVFCVGLIIVMYKLNWIEEMSKKDFLIMLITTCFIVIVLANLINYKYGSKSAAKSYIIVDNPQNGTEFSKVTISKEGRVIKLNVPVVLGATLHKNDSIMTREMNGFFGFNSMVLK